MKKTKKILIVLFIIFILILIFSEVFAIDPDSYDPSMSTGNMPEKIKTKTGVILGAVRNIGIVVSVISLMIIGVKYIFGSVQEKADYKKSLVPYIIGLILLASGTTIVSFIYNAVS